MRKLAVFSTDQDLNDRVVQICRKYQNFFEPQVVTSGQEALEFLKYELPDISLIHFSDQEIDTTALLEEIRQDPWLHYGGIVMVHNLKDRPRVGEVVKDLNVIATMSRSEFVRGFFRVLRILLQNRQILFQRDLQRYLLKSISGTLVMDNDPFNVGTYANLIPNYLYNINYLNREGREGLHVALFEMLMNAVEHGNCNITYDEKSHWLNKHGDILDLIRQKCTDPEIRRKKVHFSYRITPDRSYYSIRDEGNGFDWRSRLKPQEGREMDLHGRGILMTGVYVENLGYNPEGNQVSFEIRHQPMESNVVPSIFSDQGEIVFRDGDVVFHEGEQSNFLYYIVSGSLVIYSGGKQVSTLTPDDIFLGEMSFLLSNKRSATVVSSGTSVLIKVSKNSFVNSIKAQPHYGILLARLLAARIDRLNGHMSRLQARMDSMNLADPEIDEMSSVTAVQ